jgi:hypothetical protein
VKKKKDRGIKQAVNESFESDVNESVESELIKLSAAIRSHRNALTIHAELKEFDGTYILYVYVMCLIN